MNIMTTPAETIRRWMDERGWGEGQLSRRSGVKQPTIHRIITGESKDPRRDNLERIARAFGREVEDLYSAKAKPGDLTRQDRAFGVAEQMRGLSDDQVDLLLRIAAEFQKAR